MDILLKTVHGSHLYGLNHADSDLDYFTVVSKVTRTRKRYAKQSIVDGLDSTVVDLGTFVQGCMNGVPQYLEAMFSLRTEVDEIADFRGMYRVGHSNVYETYLRTMKSFALHEGDGAYKRRRHALRLALNMREMRETGRFNPTLSGDHLDYVTEYAHHSGEAVYANAVSLALG